MLLQAAGGQHFLLEASTVLAEGAEAAFAEGAWSVIEVVVGVGLGGGVGGSRVVGVPDLLQVVIPRSRSRSRLSGR